MNFTLCEVSGCNAQFLNRSTIYFSLYLTQYTYASTLNDHYTNVYVLFFHWYLMFDAVKWFVCCCCFTDGKLISISVYLAFALLWLVAGPFSSFSYRKKYSWCHSQSKTSIQFGNTHTQLYIVLFVSYSVCPFKFIFVSQARTRAFLFLYIYICIENSIKKMVQHYQINEQNNIWIMHKHKRTTVSASWKHTHSEKEMRERERERVKRSSRVEYRWNESFVCSWCSL